MTFSEQSIPQSIYIIYISIVKVCVENFFNVKPNFFEGSYDKKKYIFKTVLSPSPNSPS